MKLSKNYRSGSARFFSEDVKKKAVKYLISKRTTIKAFSMPALISFLTILTTSQTAYM